MNEPRQDATPDRDQTRHTPTGNFNGVLNVPSPSYSLNLYEVAARFDQAGMPRNRRSLMRYCQNNKLDARKVETPTGEEWRVDETSVERFIQQLITLARQTPTQSALTRQDATMTSPAASPSTPFVAPATAVRPLAPGPDQPRHDQQESFGAGKSENNLNGSIAGETKNEEVAPRPDQPRQDAPSLVVENTALIEQLGKRLTEKDGEIDFLRGEIATKNMQIATSSERAQETNVLIKGLQSLVLSLTGNDVLPSSTPDQPVAISHSGAADYSNQNQPTRPPQQNQWNNHNSNNPNKKKKRHNGQQFKR